MKLESWWEVVGCLLTLIFLIAEALPFIMGYLGKRGG